MGVMLSAREEAAAKTLNRFSERKPRLWYNNHKRCGETRRAQGSNTLT